MREIFDVYDLNMKKVTYPRGIVPLDIFIHSIGGVRESSRPDNSRSFIDYGFSINKRAIDLELLLNNDRGEYSVVRDELYNLFSIDKEFYIIERRNPGKRFLVSVVDSYIPSRYNIRDSTSTIYCETLIIPYAESVGTSKDINDKGLILGKDLWFKGMGLDDVGPLYYRYTGLNFPIYNAGNVENHPFECFMQMNISNVQGSSKKLEIVNTTNGSNITFNKGIKSNEKIKIDGGKIDIDGVESVRDTNKSFIWLSPGWNDFTVIGASSVVIEFIFRFYYR